MADKTVWIIAAATIAGPILAVQAQKWVERLRERRGTKQWVFQQLMATRAARLSQQHVQALNMIDLAFYGTRLFGKAMRLKSEALVLTSWREYHDHLNTRHGERGLEVWVAQSDELFINLLAAMAKDLGYTFDRVQLKKGWYSPQAHGDQEADLHLIRRRLAEVLSGDRALPMKVTDFPVDPEFAASQAATNAALRDALTGRGSLSVQVAPDKTNQ